MNSKKNRLVHKILYAALLAGLLLFLWLELGNSMVAHAQEKATPVPNTQYFIKKTIVLNGGKSVDQIIIKGPPNPPPGFSLQRAAVLLPEPNIQTAIHSLTVPAYDWVFGCSAVSGGMIAAYYDRNGYPNIYTGPTDGGVMPLNNSTWGTWIDGVGKPYPNIPLTASHQGVDGRTGRGSIDNYWVSYGSTANDPYITGGWTQHDWGDAIGDYMKTSQSSHENTDGATAFYNYTSDPSQLTCAAMVGYGIAADDGTYGRKLFYEARGYTVTDCYSQLTDNMATGGFSLAQYKAEIDAGRPVMINLAGHTIVGVGYDDSSNTIYIHDTWDYLDHSMTWGGSYSGMGMQSVSIVNLQSVSPPAGAFNKIDPTNGETNQSFTNLTLSWQPSSGATEYDYCVDTDNNCNNWENNGTDTSVSLTTLDPNVTYFWQVRALHGPDTIYANGSLSAFWSFTTEGIPTGLFEPYITNPVGQAEAVGVGDFDNDGLNDVAVTTEATSATALQILTQNDDGTLASPVSYTVGSRPEALAVGDLNSDGLDDVVVANFSSNTISVFLQKTDGTMASRITYSTGTGPDAIAVGDINGDGRDDVAVSNWNSAYISIFTQNIGGTLNTKTDYTSPQAGYDDIGIGDLNGDGLNDVVKLNGQGLNPDLSVFLQTGTGTLAGAVSYSVPGSYLGHGIGIGDVTGDGKDDVVMSYGGNMPSSNIAVFAQTTGGILGSAISYAAYDIPEPVEVKDVNLDNLADVITVHGGWEALSFYPQGTAGTLGSYSLYDIPYASHYRPQGLVIGDINNDDAPDAMIADSNNGLVILYHEPLSPSFEKISPGNGSTNVAASPTLTWQSISGATGYEYCIYTTDSNDCNGPWISTAMNTTVNLSSLGNGTTAHWQVRALSDNGEIYANKGTWWSFVTVNPCYPLTRSHSGSGSDPTASPTNSSGCSTGQYHAGQSISLTANPITGWKVGSWSGTQNNSSTSITNNATMPSGDLTVSTIYIPIPYTLSVLKNDTAGGIVTSEPPGINCGGDCSESYSYGTVITLTATVSPGWTFSSWSGGGCSGTSTCSVTIQGNTSVTANYTQNEYSLTVISSHGTAIKSPNQTTYHYGDSVQLAAIPSAGWSFTNWTGDLTSSANPVSVTIHGDTSITANYSQNEYTLAITSAHGLVTKAPEQPTYHYGDSVQLTAAPADGWSFTNWTGNLSGSSNPSSVTIVGNTFVTANYTQNEYSLTITSSHGTVIKSPNKATYHYGDSVQLTATAAAGWSFANWTGDLTSSANPSSINILGNSSVTANYTQNEYSLMIVSAHGSVTKSPDKATYHEGDVVQLTSTPAVGWSFTNWTGDVSSSSNPLNVTIHGNTSVTANYTQNLYALTITSVNGTVAKSPDKSTYHYDEVVQLTATPNAGWRFTNWTGNLSGSSNPASITIHGDASVTANYDQIEYTLNVTSTHGTVSRSPDQQTYHYGDTVQLTAIPNAGWSLASWTGDLSGNANPASVIIHGNTSVTANYTQDEYTLAITSNHGTVAKSPDKTSYHEGDVVQLTSTPDSGWSFANWTGGLSSSANPESITIHGNTFIIANYHADRLSISGNTGAGEVTLSYGEGSIISAVDGSYTINVPYGWSGTVTPSKVGWLFIPTHRDYITPLTTNLTGEDYTLNYPIFLPLVYR